MNNPVNIICMKWGDKFPASYVNRLYAMISRNITLPFQLICFTEISDGIREEVVIKPLPELDLPHGSPERGWRKLTILAENLYDLSGQALFLDLETPKFFLFEINLILFVKYFFAIFFELS